MKLSNRMSLGPAGCALSAFILCGSAAADWRDESIARLQQAPHDLAAEAATRAAAPTPPPAPAPATGQSDPSGDFANYSLVTPPPTSSNPFFIPQGTNGRYCGSCHKAADAWSLSPAEVQSDFQNSSGNAPLFRPVDGAVCPTAAVATLVQRQAAYTLLLSRALIRIGLPIPANAQFRVAVSSDPYGCNTNPATGLTSPGSGIVSVYRRPLPSTNLAYLSTIMWDGREPSLAQQVTDAILGHEQASSDPGAAVLSTITGFESNLFTSQIEDNAAGSLTTGGASAGPFALANQSVGFYDGVNDPFGHNPTHTAFNPNVFTMFSNWFNSPTGLDAAAQSIARGENLFNTLPFNISGVGGLNDVVGVASIRGTCSVCHDTPSAGGHSIAQFMDIGVAHPPPPAPAGATPPLTTAGLPLFNVQCVTGPLVGSSMQLSDLGRAMITGNCADLGHFKVPGLRGLPARAPYFHNGSAATLANVVDFYNGRFNLNLSAQQRQDLINFLQSL
ncbi:MAG: hypothetical protein P4L83_05960 [Nevskia sp.]|nr:hypothetical protein [Nevskia sp.]